MGLRRSNKLLWHTDESNGQFFGVTLMADFTAEHEWGIKKIEGAFGITKDKTHQDIRRYQITEKPNMEFISHSGKTLFGWLYGYRDALNLQKETLGHMGLNVYKNMDDASAWCDGEFAVLATTDEKRANLHLLRDAFDALDVAIWIGSSGNNPFDRGGLNLLIVSKLPADINAHITQSHIEDDALQAADIACGIRKKLQEAGKRFNALSPRLQADGTLLYWLNPSNISEKYPFHKLVPEPQCGWYTVKDLEDWIAGNGPVVTPKKKD